MTAFWNMQDKIIPQGAPFCLLHTSICDYLSNFLNYLNLASYAKANRNKQTNKHQPQNKTKNQTNIILWSFHADFWHKKTIFKKWLSIEEECKRHVSYKMVNSRSTVYLKSSHFLLMSEKVFQEFSPFLRTLVANVDAFKGVFSSL